MTHTKGLPEGTTIEQAMDSFRKTLDGEKGNQFNQMVQGFSDMPAVKLLLQRDTGASLPSTVAFAHFLVSQNLWQQATFLHQAIDTATVRLFVANVQVQRAKTEMNIVIEGLFADKKGKMIAKVEDGIRGLEMVELSESFALGRALNAYAHHLGYKSFQELPILTQTSVFMHVLQEYRSTEAFLHVLKIRDKDTQKDDKTADTDKKDTKKKDAPMTEKEKHQLIEKLIDVFMEREKLDPAIRKTLEKGSDDVAKKHEKFAQEAHQFLVNYERTEAQREFAYEQAQAALPRHAETVAFDKDFLDVGLLRANEKNIAVGEKDQVIEKLANLIEAGAKQKEMAAKLLDQMVAENVLFVVKGEKSEQVFLTSPDNIERVFDVFLKKTQATQDDFVAKKVDLVNNINTQRTTYNERLQEKPDS